MDKDKVEIILGEHKVIFNWSAQKTVAENSELFWALIDNTGISLSIYDEADLIEIWEDYCRLRMKYP